MVNGKKIEEAANLHRFELIASMHGSTLGTHMQCSEEVVDAEIDLIENSFIAGAKWAINEILKELWHDIFNERIPHGKRVIVEYTSDGGIYYRSIKIPDDIQWVRGFSCEKRLMRWLYIDDLFPKKGGGEQ